MKNLPTLADMLSILVDAWTVADEILNAHGDDTLALSAAYTTAWAAMSSVASEILATYDVIPYCAQSFASMDPFQNAPRMRSGLSLGGDARPDFDRALFHLRHSGHEIL